MQKNKYLFLILFSLIIASTSHSCKRKTAEIVIIPDALKNHLQHARLFGNIHSIETDTYYYSDKDSLYIFLNKAMLFYSSDGYLTRAIILDRNNDTVSKQIVHYLPNAKENYWIEYNYIEHGFTKDTFLYDRYGFIKERQIFANDSLLYKIQFKTDGIGGIIEKKRILPNYHLTNVMYYNEHGLVARIEEYDPHNKMYKFFTIEYDNYGDEVNRRAFRGASQIIEYTYTQYDDKGVLQKVIFEDRLHNMREDRMYLQHDAKGNWLEEVVLQGNDTLRKRIRNIEYY
ncbi:MAG: hypothetical protein FWC34_07335 [Bacteroidetes bacterium]|nr:hypothetical protein [Bacteroidota bacterium]MCL2302809.1 hypothetical protein [Lentimicrobiaceae bacterium]